jgi:hypothetical protein
MARTKQTSRKSAPVKATKATDVTVGPDYANDYDEFAKDVIGDNDSDSGEDNFDEKGKKKGRNRDDEDDGSEKPIPYMLFDFRRLVCLKEL